VLLMRGDASDAIEQAQEAVNISRQRQLQFLEGFGRTMLGLAIAAGGKHADGLEEYRDGCKIMYDAGTRFHSTGILGSGAAASLRAGDSGTAKSALDIALMFQNGSGERFWAPELERLMGEVCLTGDEADQSEAERQFQDALKTARSQGAKSFELRAAMSLARLWQTQDRKTDARELLAPVYEWFGEGLDTGDLIEARSLLQALGHAEARAAASS
jgi:predicted ATPase